MAAEPWRTAALPEQLPTGIDALAPALAAPRTCAVAPLPPGVGGSHPTERRAVHGHLHRREWKWQEF